jgi:hypothetical protein
MQDNQMQSDLKSDAFRETINASTEPTFQQSLDWAGRLGARLKKLEKKDLPR